MTDKKILVPVDFSHQSRAALQYACAFAQDCNAELLIVHVVEPEVQHLQAADSGEALEGLLAALHQVKPADESIRFSHRMLEGPTAQTILTAADEDQVDMIVMGTHGRAGLKRFVMGSVAETVVRKAKCPVLTLRQPTAPSEPSAAAT